MPHGRSYTRFEDGTLQLRDSALDWQQMGEGMNLGIRKTPRRGEPSRHEKEAAREHAYTRAGGMCELQLCQECSGFCPLDGSDFVRGQLAHKLSKRRFGWMESEETGQRHYWSCIWCHNFQHAGQKPCPRK